MRPSIYRGIVYEDSAATLLDRIQDDSGHHYASSEIISVVVESFDLMTDAHVKTTTHDPATTIVSLTTAGGWSEDDIGYNARLPLSGEHWPNGGRTYRVEATYTPVDGDPFISLYELQCVEVYGS